MFHMFLYALSNNTWKFGHPTCLSMTHIYSHNILTLLASYHFGETVFLIPLAALTIKMNEMLLLVQLANICCISFLFPNKNIWHKK